MKVLIYFKPRDKYNNFEGARLRKSIKGALETNGISYTDNGDEYFDVAHFLSVNDEIKINACIEKEIPVIVSALYAESDPSAAFLEYRKKNKQIVLTLKALRVLNKATLVLVPNEGAKRFLIDNGVLTPIEVMKLGTNISRFNQTREDEKEIFYRYYGVEKGKKVVVSIGSYDNVDGINALIKAAKALPSTTFFYFTQENPKITFKIRWMLRKAPKNIRFETIPSDDVLRSVLINADVYTYVGYDAIGVVSLLEAAAAHTEIIARKQNMFEDILVDGVNCHIGQYSETITELIKDVVEGKVESTSQTAFDIVAKEGLDVMGERLKEIYQRLINKSFSMEEKNND